MHFRESVTMGEHLADSVLQAKHHISSKYSIFNENKVIHIANFWQKFSDLRKTNRPRIANTAGFDLLKMKVSLCDLKEKLKFWLARNST